MGEPSQRASAPTVPLSVPRLMQGALFAGRYRVLEKLGEGGMGAVYRVDDEELAEQIALKVLRIEVADTEGALDRFRREVKLARRVTHPNVARTYDLGSVDGARFLTMELIVGESLAARVGHGKKLALAEALRTVREVARGLVAAHAAGVVHRDLKPDNVMIDRACDRVVITDFGIARLAEGAPQATQMRTAGIAAGTPAYMAPEQLEGKELDGRADVYALGTVLFEALTGALPFNGDTIYALAAARLAGEAPDPRTLEPSIPAPVAELVLAMLARRRDLRLDAQQAFERLDVLRGEGPKRAGAWNEPTPSSTPLRPSALPPPSISHITRTGPRVVAIAPLSTDGDASLAHDLTEALADGIAEVRGAKLLLPAAVHATAAAHVHEGVLDPCGLGRALHADYVIDGSIRIVGDRVRARVRMIDATTGVQTWADRLEGTRDDPFALEDALSTGVVAAVRDRVGESARRGPEDPTLRALYDAGRAEYARFGRPYVEKAIAIFREAHQKAPHDPWILSALGSALTRVWVLGGAQDGDMIAEAEEHSLRAIANDPNIAETFSTIGILRLQHGETRAAVSSFHEALARNPNVAEAHQYLGRLLAESGYTEEALRRFDVAVRLDPAAVSTYWERARTYVLTGDERNARVSIERANTVGGPLAGLMTQARFAMWRGDGSEAAKLAGVLDTSGPEAAPLRAIIYPMLIAFARGAPAEDFLTYFRGFADTSSASPRQRAFFYQLATEYYGISKNKEQAVSTLEKAAAMPLIDLLWFDRCPALDSIRDDPRAAKCRAMIAARVAEVWG